MGFEVHSGEMSHMDGQAGAWQSRAGGSEPRGIADPRPSGEPVPAALSKAVLAVGDTPMSRRLPRPGEARRASSRSGADCLGARSFPGAEQGTGAPRPLAGMVCSREET